MHIVVTGGGTREYIDDVRVITNVATGKISALIIEKIIEVAIRKNLLSELKITYIHTTDAVQPCASLTAILHANYVAEKIVSVADAFVCLERCVGCSDAVIHAMAVSDFILKKDGSTKLKSDSKEAFIEYLSSRIDYAPKIIAQLRRWAPTAKLIGFKFEVGQDRNDLLDSGYRLLEKNNLDFVLANDKEEMKRCNEHIGHLIDKRKYTVQCNGKDAIAESLAELLLGRVTQLDFLVRQNLKSFNEIEEVRLLWN